NRQGGRIQLSLVVDQARDREGLAVAQLHFGFGTPRGERRDPEPLQQDAVVEVEGAHFGTDVQTNEVASDSRIEIQTNAEFLEEDGNRVRQAAVNDGNGEFASCEKACFLTVVGDEIRLREALEISGLFQRLQERADVVLRVEQEQIEEVTEDQAFLIVEVRCRKLLGRAAADPVLVPGDAGEKRRAQVRQRPTVDLREPDLQHHLL